jgi:DNA replication and repair protein RecF
MVAEDEIGIITGGPDKRRLFLDHALSLSDADYMQNAKRYKQALEQRNALFYRHSWTPEEFEIWTESLWGLSCKLVQARTDYIMQLQTIMTTLLPSALPGLTITYQPRYVVPTETFAEFFAKMAPVFTKERQYKRSLFGAHLDDMSVTLNQKPMRLFASRGQQKYCVALLKLAQAQQLSDTVGPVVFLFDDFATDFDKHLLADIITQARRTASQLIFTSPVEQGPEKQYFDIHSLPYQLVTI